VVVGYGVCVGSWDKFQRFVAPHTVNRPLVTLSGQTSIAEAYNAILAAYRERSERVDALILQHDDLEIIDPDAEEKFLATLTDQSVQLVGVAGGRGDTSLAWWNSETVGHQLIDTGMLNFGERSGDVAIIEGSVMCLSPHVIETLRFDTRYPGFHSYDEICLTVRERGGRVVVADVDTHHHTTLGFSSEASGQQWAEGDQLFKMKWGKS